MKIHAASVTLVTDHLAECRAFYETHFAARAVFDCGWYVTLKLGGVAAGPEVCLMAPQGGARPYAGELLGGATGAG